MGTYRVLSSMDTTMTRTDQKVIVFELAEIEVQEIPFLQELGYQSTRFGSEGDLFVVEFNSHLTQKIIRCAQNEENIEIDLEKYRSRHEIKEGVRKKVYHHDNVILI